ncbi:hypothetical protein [Noviherbaspirillum denitrificans]|uniref:Uncharacterized protein n=1 Tax=Noviherbaspirillum denitrificans TaxID=1968433 RepID=A0A254T5W5_9BURK|nr:hypothetical protein [Noviherbaspirillum denitrificans]OWW18060.1 hypothetical protein AYR66_02725 [Noviherbaspirillum denitrificans]
MRPLLIALCLVLWLPARASASPSQIDLIYSESTDAQCAEQHNYQIRAEWAAELHARLPEFVSLWNSVAPPMLDAVTALTGKTVETPRAVRLTLCDTPSQSMVEPSVNMRFALRSFTPQAVPLRYKADTAFHEILHGFVHRHTPAGSALLRERKGESRCVRNHLHLLALQKAVLLSLGATQELAQVIAIDSQLPSACYKRAWELVNETEGTYKQYVSELAR